MVGIFISFLIMSLLHLLSALLSQKQSNLEEIGSFESGFSPMGPLLKSFSLSFFTLLMVFLVFDFEIILFIVIFNFNYASYYTMFIIWVFILGTFLIEWYLGFLSWFS